jgi:kynurenine formamidase
MSIEKLSGLISGIQQGGIKIVDLTETLRPEYPIIQLPEEFKQALPFSAEVISKYDDDGPAWYWQNITLSEHTGTHFDAPCHWVTGKDIANGSTDTMVVDNMVAPVVVIDCSTEVAADKGFILTIKALENWEAKHGIIPSGSWVFLRSDWRKVSDPENFTNMLEDGAHSPGPDVAACKWLIDERDVLGFGCETIGTDAGQAFRFEPAYPVHHFFMGAGKYGLQCMTNLDQLPATGAVIISAPLKILNGSGSPLRVLALVPS